MNNILEIKNLYKDYYDNKEIINTLDNINLSIYEGEYLSIVGPSGCGKSTLLNIIGELLSKTSGTILKDKDIRIGYMLQTDCLFPWLTILDNCLLGLKINNNLTKENISYVEDLIQTYGLEKFKNSYPSSLSGGMKQRVALIRTLATKPDILLLDEPFSALDYQTRVSVSEDVYKIIKGTGKTVIMITHDIAEAITLSDRVVILTKRPSTIKKIIETKYKDNLSPIEKRKDNLFNIYYDIIWKEIDHNV